ncbi:MFS transporter [Fulvivirgaceae bacterium PWU20]|uniref:MFS transporter n=2 Tax=Chryseosolibacter indicus TaxID=2782351 RepID=A0ABS5VUQ2_9BACT|nr:MFS transporter [Chryseosolibacter indicus]
MKMSAAEFISFSASAMMLTALGIDIMLPAFAELRQHLSLRPDSTAPSQIISFFFMGQIVQIVFGILSDRYGRLAILRIGFPLYIVGGVAATFAPNLMLMLAARFFAGMGASAVFMTTIAGVRDRFVGNQMARTMSLIFTIFLFTPVLAPFLGMAILSVASWQMVFLAPPIFAVLVFLWSLRLEESLPADKRVSLGWTSVSLSVWKVIGNKTFLRYTTVTTLLFTALSAYVGSSEHIVGTIYGRPELFAWIFAGIGLLMSLCSLLNSRLSTKYGAKLSVKGLLIAYSIIGTFLLSWTLAFGDPPGIAIFFGCVALMLAINLAVEPNSSALALEPMGAVAGMASSIYGTLFFSFGASMGSVISLLLVDGVFPLVISFFSIGIVSLVLALTDRTKY